MKRVALYAPVSTDRQDREQTIESQLAILTAWAEAQAYRLLDAYIYCDRGYSGARLDRPALDRLRDDAQAGAFDVVAILTPDRLARKFAYQALILDELRRAGCDVVFVQHPVSDDPHDQLLLQIQAAVAEYERAVLGERFRRGKLHRARAGQYVSHVAPYGYRYVPKQEGRPGYLVIDEAEAEVVRLLYGWLIDEQLTIRQILKRLHAGPWRPRNGKPCWSTALVHHILSDPVYTGVAYANRYAYVPAKRPRGRPGPRQGEASCKQLRPPEEWIPIPVPAIIDTATADRARAQLARNAQLSFRRNQKHTYLLRCLLSCGSCGLAMHGVTHAATTRQPERRYYKCAGKDPLFSGRGRTCTRRAVRAEELEAAVWAHLTALLTDPAQLLAQHRQALSLAADGDPREQEEARRLSTQAERLRREDRRLLDAYQAGIISLDELADRRRQLALRQQAVTEQQAQQTALRQERARAQTVLDDLTAFCARIATRLQGASPDEQRQILPLLIERIIVYDDHLEVRHVIPLRDPGPPVRPPGPEAPDGGLRSDGMHPTALPTRPLQDGGDRAGEALMRVADHQLHAGQAPGEERPEEAVPEGTVLARPHVEAQHLPLARQPHARGDPVASAPSRHRDDPPLGPYLHEGGVQPDIRVRPLQPPVAEALHHRVQFLAEPAHLTLGDARHPQGLHQRVHPAGRNALHIRLLDHRRQRPLGAGARFQQRGEVAAIPHARHPQRETPYARVPGAVPVAVALPGPRRRPRMPPSAQMRLDFRLHQRLAHHRQCFPEEVHIRLCRRLAKQVQQCHARRVGHRRWFSSR
jgi:site-specific DNA recombinase